MHHRTPDTVEGLGKQGFYAFRLNEAILDTDKLVQMGFKFFNNTDMSDEVKSRFNNEYLTYKMKGSFILPRYPETDKKIIIFNVLGNPNPLKFIKEDLMNVLFGFGTPKNDIFFKMFRDKLQRFFEAGLTNEIGDKFLFFNKIKKSLNFKIIEYDDGPKILTMQHLKAGFTIWLTAVTGAVLVFLGEIVYFHCSMLALKRKQKSTIRIKVKKIKRKIKVKSKNKKVKNVKRKRM